MKGSILLGAVILSGCSLVGGGKAPPESPIKEAASAAAGAVIPGGGLAVDLLSKAVPSRPVSEPESIGLSDWRERVDDCADEESDNFRRALDITDLQEIKQRCEVLLDVPCWATESGCPK